MLRHAAIIRIWTGVDGDTADGSPVVGPSGRHPGLFHAFGFCGHGFQLGPAAGAVLAELAADGRSDTDISGLGIERFLSPPPATRRRRASLQKILSTCRWDLGRGFVR